MTKKMHKLSEVKCRLNMVISLKWRIVEMVKARYMWGMVLQMYRKQFHMKKCYITCFYSTLPWITTAYHAGWRGYVCTVSGVVAAIKLPNEANENQMKATEQTRTVIRDQIIRTMIRTVIPANINGRLNWRLRPISLPCWCAVKIKNLHPVTLFSPRERLSRSSVSHPRSQGLCRRARF